MSDHKSNEDHLATDVAAKKDDEATQPKIFKLDIYSVQEIFDWLSIKDIHSVAGTCTRMQRFAGDYFKSNLKALELMYGNGQLNMGEFKEFVQKLKIVYGNAEEHFKFLGLHCKSVKQIGLNLNFLNETSIEHIKPILNKVESLECYGGGRGELFTTFPKFCPLLKHLKIFNFHNSTTVYSQWLLQSYPTLEHLKLDYICHETPNLGTFFALNPNLKKLSIHSHGLACNIGVIIQSEIKLEVLDITCSGTEDIDFHRFNQLYDQGSYQRLHLRVSNTSIQRLIDMIPVNVLENLYYRMPENSLNLNSFTNLRELGLMSVHFKSIIDHESTAKSLVNLERLYLVTFNFCIVKSFIQYASKLKAVRINNMNRHILDLSGLNKKREELIGAKKVKIYLNENDYLTHKWSKKTTDFKMISLERAESCEW